jgi:hypothetical protein
MRSLTLLIDTPCPNAFVTFNCNAHLSYNQIAILMSLDVSQPKDRVSRWGMPCIAVTHVRLAQHMIPFTIKQRMEFLRQLEVRIKQVQDFTEELVGCVASLTCIELVPTLSHSQTGENRAGLHWVHNKLPECGSVFSGDALIKRVDGDIQ